MIPAALSAVLALALSAGAQTPAEADSREGLAVMGDAEGLLKVGDAAGAVASARKAVLLLPGNAHALWVLFNAQHLAKDQAGALDTVERALAIEPDSALLLDAKSTTLNLLGRGKEAMEVADRVIAAKPNDAPAYKNRGFALALLGRREEALAALGRMAALRPAQKPFLDAALALPKEVPLSRLFDGSMGREELARLTAPSWHGKALGAGAVAAAGLLVLAALLRRRGRAGAVPDEAEDEAPPLSGLAAAGIRVDRKIGQGGMGLVFEGTDTHLGRRVAVKKMREEIRDDPRERERFLLEARLVAKLRHPNIVEIYSIVEDGSDIFLVFEYVAGKTVYDAICDEGRLSFADASAIVTAAAWALDYAHGVGVIHRDLKPANLMVTDDKRLKVMDFGVARQAKDVLARLSMTNTVVGTPPYMAPEQEQGVVRRESDVYALAVCCYEMLTGELPFQGVGAGMLMAKLNAAYIPASRAVPGLPPGLDAVLARALHPDPEERPHSAGEFAAALGALARR